MKEPLRFRECPFSFVEDVCFRNGVLDAVGGYETGGAVSRLFGCSAVDGREACSCCAVSEGALESFNLLLVASRSRSNRTPPMNAGLLATVWTDSTEPG